MITDNTYDFRSVPNSQIDAEDAFPEPYNLKILFDKSVRFRLIETYGSNCMKNMKAGCCLLLIT
jgi:hypothetical protein